MSSVDRRQARFGHLLREVDEVRVDLTALSDRLDDALKAAEEDDWEGPGDSFRDVVETPASDSISCRYCGLCYRLSSITTHEVSVPGWDAAVTLTRCPGCLRIQATGG